MLVACGRCGGIHQRGECPKRASAFEGVSQNGGIRKKGVLPGGYRRRREKPAERKFRSSALWQRKRLEIIKRDYCCRLCLMHGVLVTEQLHVHHIVPVRENEKLKLDEANLIALCPTCHEIVEKDKDKRNLLEQLASNPPSHSLNNSCKTY